MGRWLARISFPHITCTFHVYILHVRLLLRVPDAFGIYVLHMHFVCAQGELKGVQGDYDTCTRARAMLQAQVNKCEVN